MPATAAGWTALAIGAGVTTVAIQQQQAAKSGKKAQSKASKAREAARKQYELEVGEYQEIGKRQMAIQAMQSQTRTLVEVLDRQEPQQRIYTLPAAKSTDPVQRINEAIDDFVRGRYG